MTQVPRCREQTARWTRELDCSISCSFTVSASVSLQWWWVLPCSVLLGPALSCPYLVLLYQWHSSLSIFNVSSDEPQAEHCCSSIRANSNQESAQVIESSVSASLNTALLCSYLSQRRPSSYVYMVTIKWNKSPIRWKMLRVSMSIGRFWSELLCSEIHIIPKERSGLCRSNTHPLGSCLGLSGLRMCATSADRQKFVCTTCFRLCSSQLFSSRQKTSQLLNTWCMTLRQREGN